MLKSFQSLINKHLNILYLDENAKEIFMPGSMVTFRSSRKLSSYLVRAKLYTYFRVKNPGGGVCTKSRFVEDLRTGKVDGEACVLHCVYLFIYFFICLFIVCLCVCLLFTLRELFVGSCINYVV